MIFGNLIGSRTALTVDEQDNLFKHHRLIESVDALNLYDLFKRKKVLAVMTAPLSNSYHVKKMQMEDQVVRIVDEQVTMEAGVYFSKRRISKAERAQIEKALESMKSDGTLLKLLSGYMPKESDFAVSSKLP
ncbi:hypothetical protein D3C87_1219810 [compost metagenome]